MFEENNAQYKSLLSEYQDLNQRIIESESGKTKFDNAIGALFIRVSDLINDLQKKNDAGKSLNAVDLSPVVISQEGTLRLMMRKRTVLKLSFSMCCLTLSSKEMSWTPFRTLLSYH